MAQIPVVTTLHTVYEKLTRNEEILLSSIVRDSSAIIVHEHYQKKTLARYFPKHAAKIYVQHHGIRQVQPVAGAKKLLGLEGRKVILLAGYFRPSKGFHHVLKSFPRIAKEVDNATLLIACKVRGLEHSDYQKAFFDMVRKSKVKDKIVVLKGQFPQHTFDTFLSAADVFPMPYENGAQSGVMANAAAFHIPLVSSRLKAFAAFNEATGGGITCQKTADISAAIIKILEDDAFRETLRENLKQNIKPRLWHNIARNHIEIFDQFLHFPYESARYFYNPL